MVARGVSGRLGRWAFLRVDRAAGCLQSLQRGRLLNAHFCKRSGGVSSAPDSCCQTARPGHPRSEGSGRPHGLHEAALLDGGGDEGAEQRVRLEGAALELRVELHAYEPGMIRVLHRFRQEAIG